MKTHFLSSTLKDAALLVVLCVAVIAMAIYTPRTPTITKSIGSYTFVNNGDAFSLYANGSHKYILFTPITTNINKYKIKSRMANLTDLYNHIKTYLFPYKTWQTTIGSYTTIVDTNTIFFNQQTPDSNLILTYARDDIVIEGDANLITENPEELRQTLENIIGRSLIPNTSLIRKITPQTTKILLINPDIAGGVSISLPENSLVTIDKDDRTILFENISSVRITILTIL